MPETRRFFRIGNRRPRSGWNGWVISAHPDARASRRKLGRPKGSLLGISRLDGKEDEIRHFLELGVSTTAIAKLTGVRTALYSFMSTRGLRPQP